MRDLIVDELLVSAPADKVEAAKALVDKAGNIAAGLVALGFPPREVLQACCAVTGVPPAPQGWLRDPKPPPIEGLDGELCRRLEAAPVALQNGKICIAYADPEIASRSADLGFPKHQPYLALLTDLGKAMALLPTESGIDNPSGLFDDEAVDHGADGDATVVNKVVEFPDSNVDGGGSGGDVSLPFESADASIPAAPAASASDAARAAVTADDAADDDDDDPVLFEDNTKTLAVPPSAPKPVRRQEVRQATALPGGGIGIGMRGPDPWKHDTEVNTAAKTSTASSVQGNQPEPTTKPAFKTPSLATPAGGSQKVPELGALVDIQPSDTVLTQGPPVEKPEKPEKQQAPWASAASAMKATGQVTRTGAPASSSGFAGPPATRPGVVSATSPTMVPGAAAASSAVTVSALPSVAKPSVKAGDMPSARTASPTPSSSSRASPASPAAARAQQHAPAASTASFDKGDVAINSSLGAAAALDAAEGMEGALPTIAEPSSTAVHKVEALGMLSADDLMDDDSNDPIAGAADAADAVDSEAKTQWTPPPVAPAAAAKPASPAASKPTPSVKSPASPAAPSSPSSSSSSSSKAPATPAPSSSSKAPAPPAPSSSSKAPAPPAPSSSSSSPKSPATPAPSSSKSSATPPSASKSPATPPSSSKSPATPPSSSSPPPSSPKQPSQSLKSPASPASATPNASGKPAAASTAASSGAVPDATAPKTPSKPKTGPSPAPGQAPPSAQDGTRAVEPVDARKGREGAPEASASSAPKPAAAERAEKNLPDRVPSAAPSAEATKRAPTPRGGDESDSAFASADSAADKEAAANQKQRLKRIAQIASIKRYKIDRVLGRGGMATVYYATDTKTGEACALKLMEPHLADDAVFVERFKREIRASTSLNHENIVRVFDYGEENGTYYMASEFVDGGTVASLLKTLDRALPPSLVVPLMVGFLDGLECAHEQGFVHRDLKPANLMMTTTGILKIGDFGIAKAQTDTTLTKTGALFGTPAYMSPEQAQGQELDTRSDLFGVGIIFYELLSGYNPFAHENPSTTMFAIAKGHVRALFDANPCVPDSVEKVVHKLLEKDLKKRYQTAGQARDDLRAIFDHVRDKFPTAVSDAVIDPVPAVEAQLSAQSKLESDRAGKLLERNPPEHAEAAFRYYKATLLDGQNYDAVNGLTQLRADYGFRFTRPDDKQMIELEQSLEKKPDQPAVLRRLADLSATHRNLVDMAGFMKRYLRFFPGDTHVQHKLERILGTDPFAPYSILPAQVIDKTGAFTADGDMLDAARNAEEEVTATPSSQRSGVRPSAKAGAPAGGTQQGGAAQQAKPPPDKNDASNSGSRRAGGQAARGQQGASPPTPSKDGGAIARPEQTQPEQQAPARDDKPPKDSLDLIFRTVRGLFEDTIRSLTGDQGIAAMKQALKEQLSDSGGDLKGAMRAAVGKGKDVVAEGLLKEEGRQAIKKTLGQQLKQHWRLALIIVMAWVVIIGLGKACSLACGSSSAPVVTPAKKDHATSMRGQDIDDGTSSTRPAPAPKAPEPPPAPAKKPDAPATTQMSAAEEERLLVGDKPAAAVPGDAKSELAAKQASLMKQAKATSKPSDAIEIYSQVIDTDPYSVGARDAFLARGRLYLTTGDVEKAQKDVDKLKRLQNRDAIQADIDALSVDVAKAAK